MKPRDVLPERDPSKCLHCDGAGHHYPDCPDADDTCDECGDVFAESGPAAQSLACPGVCVYCYENGDDDDEEEPDDRFDRIAAERADLENES